MKKTKQGVRDLNSIGPKRKVIKEFNNPQEETSSYEDEEEFYLPDNLSRK